MMMRHQELPLEYKAYEDFLPGDEPEPFESFRLIRLERFIRPGRFRRHTLPPYEYQQKKHAQEQMKQDILSRLSRPTEELLERAQEQLLDITQAIGEAATAITVKSEFDHPIYELLPEA